MPKWRLMVRVRFADGVTASLYRDRLATLLSNLAVYTDAEQVQPIAFQDVKDVWNVAMSTKLTAIKDLAGVPKSGTTGRISLHYCGHDLGKDGWNCNSDPRAMYKEVVW